MADEATKYPWKADEHGLVWYLLSGKPKAVEDAVLAIHAAGVVGIVGKTLPGDPNRHAVQVAMAERERCAGVVESQPLACDEEWSLQQVANKIREGIIPAGPQWTKQPPTVAGMYWYRVLSGTLASIVEVWVVGGRAKALIVGTEYHVEEVSGEWSGPLKAPP
jgi:hypothetical protein